MKDRYILVVIFAVVCTVWSEDEWPDCSKPEELESCISPLEAFGDDKEFDLLHTKEGLDGVCEIMNQAFRCIDGFTKKCATEEQRNQVNRLLQGLRELSKKLCHPGRYQEEFLTHAPCLEQANDGFKQCDLNGKVFDAKFEEWIMGPNGGMSQENNSKRLYACCSFRDYLTCLNRVAMQICGEKTAKFYEDFLNQASSFLIKGHCESFDQCEGSSANRNSPHALLFPVFLIASLYALRPT